MVSKIRLHRIEEEGHWLDEQDRQFICASGASLFLPKDWKNDDYDEVDITAFGNGDEYPMKASDFCIPLIPNGDHAFIINHLISNKRKHKEDWQRYALCDPFSEFLDEVEPYDNGEVVLVFSKVNAKPKMEIVTYNVSFDISVGLDGISEQAVRGLLKINGINAYLAIQERAGKDGPGVHVVLNDMTEFFTHTSDVRVEKVQNP